MEKMGHQSTAASFTGWHFGRCTIFGLLVFLAAAWAGRVVAGPPVSQLARAASLEGTTSDTARHDAVKAIPLGKLSEENRAKVDAVLSNISIFRRLPTRVVDCDPDMYLFLVRHPDVVVNIWEVFKISRINLRETGEGQFQINEQGGATASLEFVYQSHDMHVVYGEGVYRGPLLNKPVKGRGVLVLKNGYVRETNGRYYVTCRMDSFVSIEPAGAELITKTVSPVLGKTADNNFVQTLAFLGSLSRTAEVNSPGVQRLGSQLLHIQPKIRDEFIELAAAMPEKQAAIATKNSAAKQQPNASQSTTMATRPVARDSEIR
jgi:hypothetical protein